MKLVILGINCLYSRAGLVLIALLCGSDATDGALGKRIMNNNNLIKLFLGIDIKTALELAKIPELTLPLLNLESINLSLYKTALIKKVQDNRNDIF